MISRVVAHSAATTLIAAEWLTDPVDNRVALAGM